LFYLQQLLATSGHLRGTVSTNPTDIQSFIIYFDINHLGHSGYRRGMASITEIPPGKNRTVLVVVAHADDPTLFLGGTVARWADSGWRVVVVRATDDRWDSWNLDEASTTAQNKQQFDKAMGILGVSHIVELGWPTDSLGDASELVIREQIIRQIRTHRPHTLVTFDPCSQFAEDNEDHKMIARATDEAFWTSQFDKHHPEHFNEGLAPHGCFERWYFGRAVGEVTDVVDISSTLSRKIKAACTHQTMLVNYAHQLKLQASTGGYDVPLLEEVLQSGNVQPLMEPLLRAGASRTGERYGLGAAEEFRVTRFGGLGMWLDRFGVTRTD
jgi:LmbE family N-acetylglucosaminyl deacetylase